MFVINQKHWIQITNTHTNSHKHQHPRPNSIIRACQTLSKSDQGIQVLGVLFEAQYFQNVMRVGCRLRSTLIAAVFRKTLRLTNESRRKIQSGKITNLMTTDSESLQCGESIQAIKRKPKLTLTRPTEPAFQTSQRVRSVKLNSLAEFEEEMMEKILKFKARPVNRKILEAPTLPAMKTSTPQVPEFQEFHLETMERANQNAETSTVASTEALPPIHQWKPRLTTPKTPPLQTLLRARPPTMKSTEGLEKEELNKAPKFKGRPLNKKIFESKGELGLFYKTSDIMIS